MIENRKVIGYTFNILSREDEENAEGYMYAPVAMYRTLVSLFNAIKKQFKNNVTFTIDVEEFIRRHEGRDFQPIMVGYIGDEADGEDILVKCVYAAD